MPDGRPGVSLRALRRHALLLLVAATIDGCALPVSSAALGDLLGRAASLSAGTFVAILLVRHIKVRNEGPIGKSGTTALLVLSAAVNYALYAAILRMRPELQPLAAMIVATIAAAMFGAICLWRANVRTS